ncbi:TonB-dependent receptor [Flavobacteriaceae bacterium XHP0103]|uniref:TonB-dependent receptor n=1 Tax=Marixanthotalea marina TaxID=2844359 RepID=UPI002989D97D|nr:TonB-dependent receptor [Marixanthotalea marina]MBU3820810.1 TonB-dependent receptor [Marixanthotalea marina]
MKTIFNLLSLLFCATLYSQSTISGTVTDDSGLPVPGANVIVLGTNTGAITDFDGNFTITYSSNPPFTIQASSVGFETASIDITDNNQVVNIVLKVGTSLDEIVISASRTPERVFESPVTVERFGLKEIKNTASADFYDGLENLKGVDINTNSLTFKSLNTRGFATFANNRFMQLVDGMDNSSPALNFPLGNLLGMVETDVLSVEILPGASSALYGANAFNGILFMRSKNPFDFPGISATIKRGVTSQKAAGTNEYTDVSIRAAYKFSNKFAGKVNFGYLKGTDWAANNLTDKYNPGKTRANPDYDGINVYGDELQVPINFDQIAIGLGLLPPGTVLMGTQTVTRTGYNEGDLTNYNAESVKADWGLYYRPWENDFEISYVGKIGVGSTIYQGTNRYNINGFFQEQHKLEVKNDHFFLRGYVVADKAGDSYDMVATGVNINNAWKSREDWYTQYTQAYISTFLTEYGSGGNPNPAIIHQQARAFADIGRFEPGTPEFEAAFNRSINDPNLLTGSKFQDQSKYYHVNGNYNFSHLINWAEIQVGGSYRQYSLNSSGTIYTDFDGPIDYEEFGVYSQIQKNIELNDVLDLKLTGSLRYDKSEFFDGFFSPRISAGLTLNENHNFRASVQTGFRNPSTQDLFIGLDAGLAVLVGAAPTNLDRYVGNYNISSAGQQLGVPAQISQAGRSAYENSYTLTALQTLGATGNPAVLADPNAIANPDLVKPEQITSYEIGYRGKFNNLIIDFSAYYNNYKDFISQPVVVAPFYGTVGDNSLSIAAIANGDYKLYGTYTNSDADVSSYGASIGISKKIFGDFDLEGNYTFAKQEFDKKSNPDFPTNFNTPEHKTKVSFGNTELFKNFGFNVAWRWSDSYFWEATFGNGDIPSYHVVDAQINYKVPSLKSIFKAGATNLTGEEYFTAFGTGYIGSMYYLSWTINNL